MEPIQINKQKNNLGLILVVSVLLIIGVVIFISIQKDGQICAYQRCLLERNADLSVENSLQLSKSKGDMIMYEKLYNDSKSQYQERQKIKAQLDLEQINIINSGLNLSEEVVFQLDRELSLISQQAMTEKTAK